MLSDQGRLTKVERRGREESGREAMDSRLTFFVNTSLDRERLISGSADQLYHGPIEV